MALLLVIAGLMLGTSFLLWRLLETHGSGLWTFAANTWNALRRSEAAQRLRAVPGFGHALTHGFSAARYLGAHAVASFALALAMLIAFFELAEEIGLNEELGQFDVALSDSLSRHVSRDVLVVFAWLTKLGNAGFLVTLMLLVTALLLLQRRTLLAAWWALATASGTLLNMLLKALFERTRPVHEHGIVAEYGWSFPSGHASGSMLVYGLLGYLLIRHMVSRGHLPIALLCVTLIVFVGFSRVLLQVHYLSDVLAGYASAAAWGALCVAGAEALHSRGAKSG